MNHVWSTYYDNNHSRNNSANTTPAQSTTALKGMDDAFIHVRRPPSADSSQSHRPFLTAQPSMERLSPPVPSFSNSGSPRSPVGSLKGGSLTAHYLPTKFSQPQLYKRKGKDTISVPKQGGGREAFKSGEARMPGAGDEDYDGVMPREGGKTKPRLRWNRFKWMLFLTNTVLTVYSIVGLIFCILTWFNVWENADIIRVGNRPELILSTLAAAVGILACLIGWSGILLNNRAFLAIYTLVLWITFAFLVVPGYVSYKRRTFNLEGKINSQWSRELGTFGRLRIQNELGCCGYFNPFVEASISQSCYARSMLEGCKGPYLKFQRKTLERWYTIVFSLVPVHIGIMIAALLCSNHVTYRFGKGMMPKAYRLNMGSVAMIMDGYASQLADQYGPELADDVLARTRQGYNGAGSKSLSGLRSGPGSTSNLVEGLPNTSEHGYIQPSAGYFGDTGSGSGSASGSGTAYSPGGYGGSYGHVVGGDPGYDDPRQQGGAYPRRI